MKMDESHLVLELKGWAMLISWDLTFLVENLSKKAHRPVWYNELCLPDIFSEGLEELYSPSSFQSPSENVIELELYRLMWMLDSSYHREFDFFYEALVADRLRKSVQSWLSRLPEEFLSFSLWPSSRQTTATTNSKKVDDKCTYGKPG